MAESVSVNSVQPREISDSMVAYLLTVSILGGAGYDKAWTRSDGLPIILGHSKDEVLKTYAECRRTVHYHNTEEEREARSARRS
jgi:hypothetical protein